MPAEPTVLVYSHIEALGMVVEVLTAQNADALQNYLRDKNLNVQVKQLTSLQSYFNQPYSFVCSWKKDKTVMARAVFIDFPAFQAFYPLLPSSANPTEITTNVYLRGWYESNPSFSVPGFRCDHLLAKVIDPAMDKYLGIRSPDSSLKRSQLDAVRSSRITQVTVTSNPADWKQDLTLLPGASLVENIAGQIASMGIAGLTALAGLVGILLSPIFIVSIKDRPRTWNDWGWA